MNRQHMTKIERLSESEGRGGAPDCSLVAASGQVNHLHARNITIGAQLQRILLHDCCALHKVLHVTILQSLGFCIFVKVLVLLRFEFGHKYKDIRKAMDWFWCCYVGGICLELP